MLSLTIVLYIQIRKNTVFKGGKENLAVPIIISKFTCDLEMTSKQQNKES